MTIQRFRKIVWTHAQMHGRHALPWRSAKASPYHVLVSEVMLQQTQVDRVIPYYRALLKEFPTVRRLADAPLSGVLRAWQGLGYNRRAKLLQLAAQKIVAEHGGNVPRDIDALERLPGIGPYTARAIAAFAYDEDTVFIETNLRTAVIHHFFPEDEAVSDATILAVLEKAFPKGKARAWYAALMDYGAHLKRSGVRVNSRAKAYAKQSRFTGSSREARGAILRALVSGPKTVTHLTALLGPERKEQLTRALSALRSEAMVVSQGRLHALPGAGREPKAKRATPPRV